MTTYRIIPFGTTTWGVQRRSWFGWLHVLHGVFDTEEKAENWILSQLGNEKHLAGVDRAVEARRKAIQPRIYPSRTYL